MWDVARWFISLVCGLVSPSLDHLMLSCSSSLISMPCAGFVLSRIFASLFIMALISMGMDLSMHLARYISWYGMSFSVTSGGGVTSVIPFLVPMPMLADRSS